MPKDKSWSASSNKEAITTMNAPVDSNSADNVPKTDYASQSLYKKPQQAAPWYSDPREPFPARRGHRKRRRAHSRARIRQLEILYGLKRQELIQQQESLGIKILPQTKQIQTQLQSDLPPSSPGPHTRSLTTRSWADIVKPAGVAKQSQTAQIGHGKTTSGTAQTALINEPASPSSASSLSATTRTSEATELEPAGFSAEEEYNQAPPVLVPRGLVNTGNMCFMNSILQILLHCVPFYTFIDVMRKKRPHNFNSDTPILDSLILFVQEFSPQAVANFGQNGSGPILPRCGEPFTPEFVYDALRTNRTFAGMRRGHQEDAEEFLGFLLDGLHEEFLVAARQLQKSNTNGDVANKKHMNFVESALAALKLDEVDVGGGEGWLEVGKKHKVAVTRTISVVVSPITKLFGGQFRSVIQAAHQKPSITLDPYQRVQLDISDPSVYTIEDALAHISQTEVISQYKSSQGDMVEATKQTFFETLPKVLILHLKRFHFIIDEDSGYASIQKITKTIGYKRSLQIPPECVSPQHRAKPVRYKLFGVVYHHGKSTEGGHYTVDLNYKHDNRWINFDDVNIKDIDLDAVETEYEDESTTRRRFMNSDDWEQRTAYLLFYERVE
ncbi:hypothetical protein V1512DRAFT_208675 [Lipomyces arxii]|uniref:uncharacterized protein n=1 Tax=Lipomyces arxii TaxID=56418 RepID=UPI0034CF3B04